jgi:phage tail-like protein
MATRVDPYLGKNFNIAIENTPAISLSEVLGIETTIDVVDYREGTDLPNTVRKLPGLARYGNVILKRGFTQDLSLWTWMYNNLSGQADRRQAVITLFDQAGNTVLQWSIKNAWPCRWSGPELRAESSDVAIETLELCCESIIMTGPS